MSQINWSFTLTPRYLNDDDGETAESKLRENHPNLWDTSKYRYIVFQVERGAQGTTHVQGYIQTLTKLRLGGVKKLLGDNTVHLEKAIASPEANKEYCTKEDTRLEGPWEFGTMSRPGVKRAKLEEICEEIEEGKIRTIEEIPAALRVRYKEANFEQILNHTPPPPAWREVKVLCLIGPTRIGKTWTIHNLFPDKEICKILYGNCGIWAAHYIRQDVLLLDEFNCQIKLQTLLQMLEGYSYSLESKGTLVKAHYTKVIICSNKDPHSWYEPDPTKEDNRKGEREALMARIGLVIKPGSPCRGLTLNYLENPWTRTCEGVEMLRKEMIEKIKNFFEI